MTAERWNYIKALKPDAPRMFWNSSFPEYKGTYNVGKNAEKRAKKGK